MSKKEIEKFAGCVAVLITKIPVVHNSPAAKCGIAVVTLGPDNLAGLLRTGREENALSPINRRAVAAMLVFETQSMVPRWPVKVGNRYPAQ